MSEGRAPVRIGVIGMGAISQVVHVPIFAEREDVELVAMADSDPHKAEALSRRFDVPLVMDAEELIDIDELDAVVLCTPNRYHEAHAIAARLGGVAVSALDRSGLAELLGRAEELLWSRENLAPHRRAAEDLAAARR